MILRDLGLAATRAVIPHVDDLGASHGANRAFLELFHAGRVTCGSVIVPGPWFREIADAAGGDPALDIGVHLTLTSEWDSCRWAPISTVSPASGLVDADGYFWRDLESVRRNLVPEAAEAELRAQIERAFSSGIRPTHIDAHMAVAMLPALLEAHVRLGHEYGLFPVLPRSITWAPDLKAYRSAIDGLDGEGEPVVDHCRGTLAVEPERLAVRWTELLHNLPQGLTHLALHCTAPGDFAAMSPLHAPWRYAEYDMLARGTLDDLLAAEHIAVVGTRALQSLFSTSRA